MKTYMANPDKIERKWYVVDAAECTDGKQGQICRISVYLLNLLNITRLK